MAFVLEDVINEIEETRSLDPLKKLKLKFEREERRLACEEAQRARDAAEAEAQRAREEAQKAREEA